MNVGHLAQVELPASVAEACLGPAEAADSACMTAGAAAGRAVAVGGRDSGDAGLGTDCLRHTVGRDSCCRRWCSRSCSRHAARRANRDVCRWNIGTGQTKDGTGGALAWWCSVLGGNKAASRSSRVPSYAQAARIRAGQGRGRRSWDGGRFRLEFGAAGQVRGVLCPV